MHEPAYELQFLNKILKRIEQTKPHCREPFLTGQESIIFPCKKRASFSTKNAADLFEWINSTKFIEVL